MTALPKLKMPAAKPQLANGEQRLLVYDITWQQYQDIGEALRDRPIYLTYDRGKLEIMVVGTTHERFKGLFPMLIVALAESVNRTIGSFGSFTHQRKDLKRGLEPDQCFYIAHFADVCGKKDIDLLHDPPPDLAVEIEISHRLLDRIGIYEALKVPELWRFDGERLTVLLLTEGRYQEGERSASFPEIPVGELPRFLPVGIQQGDIAMMDAVRSWVGRILAKTRKKKRRK